MFTFTTRGFINIKSPSLARSSVASKNSAFPSLPPLDRTSTLHLLSCIPTTLSSPESLRNPPSPLSTHAQNARSQTQHPCAECPNKYSRNANEPPYAIPSLQHPNSPYIPWAPSVRSQILRPMTPESESSVPSSSYSRPLSRTGARAPEPASEQGDSLHVYPRPQKTLLAVAQTVKDLGGRLKNNFRGLAKRMGKYTRPRPNLVIPPWSSQANLDSTWHSSSVADSVISITLSSDFQTLSEWLEDRHRSASEDMMNGPRMSLDEYERHGSWLELVPTESKEKGWICGRPGCELHRSDLMNDNDSDDNVPANSCASRWTPKLHSNSSER